MLDESHRENIVVRLNRIEGQVREIRRLVTQPRRCAEILQQLAQTEAALKRVSLIVFKFHAEGCVPEGVESGEPERTERLSELISIFDRFSK
jgi:DNA-binding FrmR family transcriptional regulator